MACTICETRRPRRFCPGVRGDICTVCCGTEREVTVDCPLECEFLQEARRHDRPAPVDPATVPNQDIRVTESFLRAHEMLLTAVSRVLAGAALESGAVDSDVREALESLIRTQRTLQSGVIYDSVPSNPFAARIYAVVRNGVAEFRSSEQQQLGMSRTRDADVLGVLVFLERVEYDRSNGRRRGRAFIDFLQNFAAPPAGSVPQGPPSLIVP